MAYFFRIKRMVLFSILATIILVAILRIIRFTGLNPVLAFSFHFFLLMSVLYYTKKEKVDLKTLIGEYSPVFETTAVISLFISLFFAMPFIHVVTGWISKAFLNNQIHSAVNFGDTESNILKENFDVVYVLMVSVFAPFVEELFFRKVMIDRLSFKWNTFTAVIVSSICFGLSHGFDKSIAMSVFGIIMSIIYLETSSIKLCYILHMVYNAIICILPAVFLLGNTALIILGLCVIVLGIKGCFDLYKFIKEHDLRKYNLNFVLEDVKETKEIDENIYLE